MDSLLLNIKSNWKILQLEALIKANDPSQDLSRTAVFEREVQAAQHVDWKEIQLSLLDLKKRDGTPSCTSFQAKVSPDTAKILEQVQSDMMHQLSLKRLKVNYMVLLLQRNYLNQLKSRQKNYVWEKNGCKTDWEETDINMPTMAQLLVEMMLSDHQCAELEQIKTLVLEWKTRQLEEHYQSVVELDEDEDYTDYFYEEMELSGFNDDDISEIWDGFEV